MLNNGIAAHAKLKEHGVSGADWRSWRGRSEKRPYRRNGLTHSEVTAADPAALQANFGIWVYRKPFSIRGAIASTLAGVTKPTPVSLCKPGMRYILVNQICWTGYQPWRYRTWSKLATM